MKKILYAFIVICVSIFCSSSVSAGIIWAEKVFVDEFGDETGEKFLLAKGLKGTFSNSAVDNEDLLVSVYIMSDSIGFRLYEYNDTLVKNIYSSTKKYTVDVKDGSGDKHEFIGSMMSDMIKIRDKAIFNIFDSGGDITFIITDDDFSVCKYKVTLRDVNGVSKRFKDVFGEDMPSVVDAELEGTEKEVKVLPLTAELFVSKSGNYYVLIETNIPDNISISSDAHSGDRYIDSWYTDVRSGVILLKIRPGIISLKGSILKVTIEAGSQSPDIKKLYGSHLEKLTGESADKLFRGDGIFFEWQL
jgi:hypothetical protein